MDNFGLSMMIATLLSSQIMLIIAWLYIIVYFTSIIPSISLAVRRLHDTNTPGWILVFMIPMNVVPIIGGPVSIFLLARPSSDEGIKYDKYYNMYSSPKILNDMISLSHNISEFEGMQNVILKNYAVINNVNMNNFVYSDDNTGAFNIANNDYDDDYEEGFNEDDDISYTAMKPVINNHTTLTQTQIPMQANMNRPHHNNISNARITTNNNNSVNTMQSMNTKLPNNIKINANSNNNTANMKNTGEGRLSRARDAYNNNPTPVKNDEYYQEQRQKKIDDLYNNTNFTLELGDTNASPVNNPQPRKPVASNNANNRTTQNNHNNQFPNNPANSNFIRR